MSEPLILHYAPDNASLIVRLALEHRGLGYETRLVDRAAHAQEGAAYRRLNPNGLIPVLETPNGAIFETAAILLWLADRYGGLAPAPDAADRGDFLKWLFYISNTLHPALRMMFYPGKYIGAGAGDQAQLRSCTEVQLAKSLATLEDMAAGRPAWLGAETPSVMNFYIAACLRWCALYPADYDRSWFLLTRLPHLQAICRGVETLPCCGAVVAAEGLGPTPFTNPTYANPPHGSAT